MANKRESFNITLQNVSREALALIKRASRILGLDSNEFIMHVAIKTSEEVVKKEKELR